MQLMQVYSQKSTRTTLPLSSFWSESGALLIQVCFPVKSGAGVPGVSSARTFGVIAAKKRAVTRTAERIRCLRTMPPGVSG